MLKNIGFIAFVLLIHLLSYFVGDEVWQFNNVEQGDLVFITPVLKVLWGLLIVILTSLAFGVTLQILRVAYSNIYSNIKNLISKL